MSVVLACTGRELEPFGVRCTMVVRRTDCHVAVLLAMTKKTDALKNTHPVQVNARATIVVNKTGRLFRWNNRPVLFT